MPPSWPSAAAQRRIESRLGMATVLERPDEGLWTKADSYTLAQALSYLAGRLRNEAGVGELRFRLARHCFRTGLGAGSTAVPELLSGRRT